MSPSSQSTIVVKVGGSLLDHPELPQKLFTLLDARSLQHHSNERRYFIVGGGILVNQLRDFDKANPQGEEFCHWSAIRLMSETAKWFQARVRLAGWNLPIQDANDAIDSKPEIHNEAILDCGSFMTNRSRLPKNWNTTSDSIAAELASSLNASELCLIKAALPTGSSFDEWKMEGVVDSNFPKFAKSLARVTLFDLKGVRSLSVEGS